MTMRSSSFSPPVSEPPRPLSVNAPGTHSRVSRRAGTRARTYAFTLIVSVSGCACAVGEPDPQGSEAGNDASASAADATMDARVLDAITDAVTDVGIEASVVDVADAGEEAGVMDAALDSGFVFDGAVPEASALLFSEINCTGDVKVVTNDDPDLAAFRGMSRSMIVAAGYTVYGTTRTHYGGDLSAPFVGPMTINDLGEVSGLWESIILRQTTEPTATVYRSPGASPKVYPLGAFPSLGATTDVIDGVMLPAGVSLTGYEDPIFGGTERGPYVGPLDVGTLPFRDVWSSLVIRASNAEDLATGQVTFYESLAYTGSSSVILTIGEYPNLNELPSLTTDFNNVLSSVRGRSGLSIFGFQFPNFGGVAYGPIVGDTSPLPGENDWDSIIIKPVGEPTLSFYWESGFVNPLGTYPITMVPNLQGRSNVITSVSLPPGYVIYGFSHSGYGGLTWRHTSSVSELAPGENDNWDSFIARPADEPSVTFYFGAAMTVPRVYPLGSYRDLQTESNKIAGASVPCGVRVTGYDDTNFGGTQYVRVTGPTNIATVNGAGAWSSMIIERDAAAICQ